MKFPTCYCSFNTYDFHPQGIASLHQRGIVHRDLKPENILMDVQGRTRISDFGLAGLVSPERGLVKCCGTRGYWAPEMLTRPRTPYFLAVDWFALGVRVRLGV